MSRSSTKGSFVKERLLEARDARGVTQADLGKAIGKSAPAISNWERGEQAPEPASLENVAAALDVAPSYLTKPMPDHGNGAIFFRSLANATARARTREKARVRWLQHISLSLQNTLEFPGLDIPDFVEGRSYVDLYENDLERVALAMRAYWNLGEGPIRNMVLVAENAGVVVGVDEVGSIKIDGQGTWSSFDGRPYILLANDKNTAFRRQTDVAHELAHIILHRGVSDIDLEKNFDLIEHQAKYLASAFLLPHRSFSAEIFSLSLDGFLSLKPRWMVSIGAMIMRARQLSLLSEEAAQRLWKYRATRGWHRLEPLDLPTETPVENPRLLKRSVEMLVSSKVRTKRDLLEFDIGLGANDVELMTALDRGFFDEAKNIIPLEPRLKEDPPRADHESTVLTFKRPN